MLRIRVTILNLMQHLQGEIFRPHAKFLIVQIPDEMV